MSTDYVEDIVLGSIGGKQTWSAPQGVSSIVGVAYIYTNNYNKIKCVQVRPLKQNCQLDVKWN